MIQVRRATREDARKTLDLIQALADYEQLDGPDAEAQARLIHDGWPPDETSARFAVWLAELKAGQGTAEAVGYAITFETYSSFLAQPTLYIEDLFVLPHHRQCGAGSALMQRLIEEARARGCGRIEWVVLDWNTGAQEFYRKLGGQHLTEWQHYRMQIEM